MTAVAELIIWCLLCSLAGLVLNSEFVTRSLPQGHKPQARNDATPRGLDPLARGPSYHAKQHSGAYAFVLLIGEPAGHHRIRPGPAFRLGFLPFRASRIKRRFLNTQKKKIYTFSKKRHIHESSRVDGSVRTPLPSPSAHRNGEDG